VSGIDCHREARCGPGRSSHFDKLKVPSLSRDWIASASRACGTPRNDQKARMKHCIYPGSFDPVTNGHLDVLQRAAKLFDHVTVAVALSTTKTTLFSAEQRVAFIQANVRKLANVEVVSFDGLLVEFARQQKANAIIRGLRALSDFEFEFNMALMNRHLEPEVETIFVMPNEAYSYTSSALVKQIAKLGGDVNHFVPANVAKALKAAK
jgi:pantetheine-phosphate adenylyltransferase